MNRFTSALLFAAAAAALTTAQAGDAFGGPPAKAKAHGQGTYEIAGTTADFALQARQKEGRQARGTFRHTLVFQGLLIDFDGAVTCMSVDADQGRAWIGGVVTANNSDHPSFVGEIHQPGRDVWFRVLDTGQGPEADRTTFLGFEGAGGIITSEEYCQARIWPGPPDDEPNARTNPVVAGGIKVQARPDDEG